MEARWIFIEVFAVLVEITAYVYFLSKRYPSKKASPWPTLLAWSALAAWGLVATFNHFPPYLYDGFTFFLLLSYMFLSRQGRVLQKIFAVALTYAILFSTSLAGAGLAGVLTDTSYQHSLETQGTARMLAIIFIKTLQLVVYYLLAKRHFAFRNLKRRPVLVLCGATLLTMLCITLVWLCVQTPDISRQQNLLTGASVCLFALVAALFVMYELFVKEEEQNVALHTQLQRTELEAQFRREIDAMYMDMRSWRHDYRNNLTALRALLAENKTADAVNYINSISQEPELNRRTLQTGNLVLDAVASTKLWLAHAKGIQVSIQAVYPENAEIADSDLCSIVGNLLDNAIEACERMNEADGQKFLDFSILVSGRNLLLTIRNSFNGELKQDGGRYQSMKGGSLHGLGLPHVEALVEKYQGSLQKIPAEHVFETHVLLPLLAQKGK